MEEQTVSDDKSFPLSKDCQIAEDISKNKSAVVMHIGDVLIPLKIYTGGHLSDLISMPKNS